MPVAKPTSVPNWASSALGISRTLTPPDVIDGWAPGTKPPAQYLNYLLHNTSSWLLYLQALTTQANEWLGIQTFDAGIIVSNPGVNGQAVAASCSATGSSAVNATATATGATAIKAIGSGGGLGLAVLGGATIDSLAATLSTPAPIYPTLSSGYTTGGGVYPKTHYFKDNQGLVHVFVQATAPSTSDLNNVAVFTLPAGYRPQGLIPSLPCFITTLGGEYVGALLIDAAGRVAPFKLSGQTGNLYALCGHFVFNPSATTA